MSHIIKGVVWAKMFKIIKFLFFAKKVSSGMGGITSQISRGLAALEPPQNGGKRGAKWGGGFVFLFVFNRKRKKMEKIFCTFCRKSFKGSKTVFFSHYSIKTEEVLFFYIYK